MGFIIQLSGPDDTLRAVFLKANDFRRLAFSVASVDIHIDAVAEIFFRFSDILCRRLAFGVGRRRDERSCLKEQASQRLIFRQAPSQTVRPPKKIRELLIVTGLACLVDKSKEPNFANIGCSCAYLVNERF